MSHDCFEICIKWSVCSFHVMKKVNYQYRKFIVEYIIHHIIPHFSILSLFYSMPPLFLAFAVVFVVFSRSPSLVAAIGEDIVLDCGYRQRDTPTEQNLGLEWRWQYKGQGKSILDMKETEGGTFCK